MSCRVYSTAAVCRWHTATRAGIALLCLLPLLVASTEHLRADEPAPIFIRGDANVDRRTTLSDVFLILRYLSLGSSLGCKSAADVDDNGRIEQTDALLLLGALFYRHEPPPPPFLKPGTDPTPSDGLGCRQGLHQGIGGAVDGLADEPEGGAITVCDENGWGADLEFIHFRGPILAFPGENRVRVPILMRSGGELEGFTLSLHAKSEFVHLKKIEFAGTIVAEQRPGWVSSYTQQLRTGHLSASVALSMSAPFQTLPWLNNEAIAFLELSIDPAAPVGETLEVEFADTPGTSSSPPISNEVSRRGFSQDLGICGLRIHVVSGEDLFIRGDVNRDRSTNLTDVVRILQALYVGADESLWLPCPDAADVDDSGTVGLTDAIGLASYFFGQAAAPRSPYPQAGHDETPDSLGCAE